MNKIKALLEKVPQEKFEDWFQQIATLLFEQYEIQTSTKRYQFVEIEFYYYNDNHKDESTYGYIKNPHLKNRTKDQQRIHRHKLCQHKQLTWFFHYSGIDLVIGRKDEPGGMLIRAIRDIQTGEIIKGPLVVMLELLNQNVDVEKSENFQLKLVETENPVLTSINELVKRVGINYGGFELALYNFSIV